MESVNVKLHWLHLLPAPLYLSSSAAAARTLTNLTWVQSGTVPTQQLGTLFRSCSINVLCTIPIQSSFHAISPSLSRRTPCPLVSHDHSPRRCSTASRSAPYTRQRRLSEGAEVNEIVYSLIDSVFANEKQPDRFSIWIVAAAALQLNRSASQGSLRCCRRCCSPFVTANANSAHLGTACDKWQYRKSLPSGRYRARCMANRRREGEGVASGDSI